jgi:pyridinium-3,5-biscarboxylic acid mononucleotide synthase
MTTPAILDWDRVNRVGITEAVLCEPKTADHLVAVLDHARSAGRSMLLKRLTVPQLAALPSD